MSFQRLGRVPPESLKSARLNLHFAVQALSATGAALVPPQKDDSHTSLSVEPGRLVGQPMQAGLRVGLGIEDLKLVVLDERGGVVEAIACAGRTLDQVFEALTKTLGKALGQEVELRRPGYDLPDHELLHAGTFTVEREPLAELGRYFETAALALADQQKKRPGASPVRLWPHHFDIAILIALDPDPHAESARSVGVGLSPGDGSYPEPYFYVSPWPYPKAPELPALPEGGHFHTEGFFAAVMTAGALIDGATTAEAQAGRLAAFLDGATAASLGLLGARE